MLILTNLLKNEKLILKDGKTHEKLPTFSPQTFRNFRTIQISLYVLLNINQVYLEEGERVLIFQGIYEKIVGVVDRV